MTRMVEHTKAIIRGEAPPPPVAKLIGFDVVSVEPGESVVEFQAREVHRNPMGTLHGGILCDIADALISIIGCSLVLLGALYLAYDLLGGAHVRCER